MAGFDRKALIKRIRRWQTSGKKIDGTDQPLTYLQLLHLGEHGQSPVDGWPINEDTELELTVRDVSETIEGDAGGHKGSEQTYYLCAYFGDMSPESMAYGARFPINILRVPDVALENAEIAGDNVSPRGQLANNQRHLERVMQLTLNPMQENQRMLLKVNQELSEENTKLRQELSSMRDWYETSRTQEHLRQISERKWAFWEEKKEQIASAILPLLPAIIAQLIKRPDIAPAPETTAVREFFKQIDGDQWDALIGDPATGKRGILSPTQSIMFQAAMKQFMSEEDKEEKNIDERRKKLKGGGEKPKDDNDDLDEPE